MTDIETIRANLTVTKAVLVDPEATRYHLLQGVGISANDIAVLLTALDTAKARTDTMNAELILATERIAELEAAGDCPHERVCTGCHEDFQR